MTVNSPPSQKPICTRLFAEVRRVVMSKSFETIYDGKILRSAVTGSHPLVPVVPVNGRRMTFAKEIVLINRNRDERLCMAEPFNTT